MSIRNPYYVKQSQILMHVYPEFIAPLFDKYSPLPEGVLKTKIEELAASLDYPLKKLYVVEGNNFFRFSAQCLFCTLKILNLLKEFQDSFQRFKLFHL